MSKNEKHYTGEWKVTEKLTVAMLKLERRRLARQPASQAVAELESEAIPRQSVHRPPMASISNSAKEEGRQQWLLVATTAGDWRRRLAATAADGGGGWWWHGADCLWHGGGCWRRGIGCWQRGAAAAASEKGPYFFSLAASACLVGRSPFTVLRKVSTFLMPFLEIPGLFRHL